MKKGKKGGSILTGVVLGEGEGRGREGGDEELLEGHFLLDLSGRGVYMTGEEMVRWVKRRERERERGSQDKTRPRPRDIDSPDKTNEKELEGEGGGEREAAAVTREGREGKERRDEGGRERRERGIREREKTERKRN